MAGILFNTFGYKMDKIMKWIKLKDRIPVEEIDGEKVLICRTVNKEQSDQALSILPVNKIHLCESSETWWMHLPELPNGCII